MVNSLESAVGAAGEWVDLLSLSLTKITVSSDRADLGNLGTLLSIINLDSREVRLDPILSEFRAILVLQISRASYTQIARRTLQ